MLAGLEEVWRSCKELLFLLAKDVQKMKEGVEEEAAEAEAQEEPLRAP